MITLHSYVLRELLKAFALTFLALMTMFTMGGGLFNVMSFEGVTTADVVRFLPLMIPIAATLTAPLAALFAATIVYGRLAADNELTAARAAGINIHAFVLPSFLLAVITALATFYLANFVIPGFFGKLEEFARNNVRDIVLQRLQQRGYFHRRLKDRNEDWYLTAERASVITNEAAGRKGFPTDLDYSYMLIERPTALQVTKERVTRFMTAEYGFCQFDRSESPVRLLFIAVNAIAYEVGKQAVRFKQQRFGPIPLPTEMPERPEWASLDKLLVWTKEPWRHDGKVGSAIDAYLLETARRLFYRDCVEQLEGHAGSLVLFDVAGSRYSLTAASAISRPPPNRGRPRLRDVEIVIHKEGQTRPLRYLSPWVEIIATALPDETKKIQALVTLHLRGTPETSVLEFNPRADDYERARPKDDVMLDGLLLPEAVRQTMAGIDRAAVLDSNKPLPLGNMLEDARTGLRSGAAEFRREVMSLIQFRLASSAAILVTVVMGAILGIMFRGAHILAAFGLSFIPVFAVALVIIRGRQVYERESEPIGLVVIWGGLLLVALLDGLLLRLGVRR